MDFVTTSQIIRLGKKVHVIKSRELIQPFGRWLLLILPIIRVGKRDNFHLNNLLHYQVTDERLVSSQVLIMATKKVGLDQITQAFCIAISPNPTKTTTPIQNIFLLLVG